MAAQVQLLDLERKVAAHLLFRLVQARHTPTALTYLTATFLLGTSLRQRSLALRMLVLLICLRLLLMGCLQMVSQRHLLAPLMGGGS